MAQRWDVFVSYAHEDEAWVGVLAENLHRAGRVVFFDRWEVVGGDRLSERLQQGLESSEAVVLVVSRAAVDKPWWREGPRAARLRIDRQQVVFSCAEKEWTHQPLGVDGGLRTLVREVARAAPMTRWCCGRRHRPGACCTAG